MLFEELCISSMTFAVGFAEGLLLSFGVPCLCSCLISAPLLPARSKRVLLQE